MNDQKNGKGKKYNSNNEVFFEGEYLYNYIIKGKEYNEGRLKYEGEYLFNMRWNGKEYDNNGKVKKEYINGLNEEKIIKIDSDEIKNDFSNKKNEKTKNIQKKLCLVF